MRFFSSLRALLLGTFLLPGNSESTPERSRPSLRRGMLASSDDNSGNSILRPRTPRIINGRKVRYPHRYPYFALMDSPSGLCGAVLISRRFVLTAAHCVDASQDFEICVSGDFSGFDASETFGYTTRVIHPEYTDRLDYDLALYELDRDLGEDLPYLRLDNESVQDSGEPLTVIGFGDTESQSNEFLRRTIVDSLSQDDCLEWMGEDSVGDDMLCAFREGTGICDGDSGGPLFREGETPEEDALVGLVSWAPECGGGDLPQVYTRISYFYDWIVETMCDLNPEGVPDYVNCEDIDTNDDLHNSHSGQENSGGNSDEENIGESNDSEINGESNDQGSQDKSDDEDKNDTETSAPSLSSSSSSSMEFDDDDYWRPTARIYGILDEWI